MNIKSLVPQKTKNYYHLAQAAAANYVYGFPSRGLKVIGVTGTNGKTTTVQMIGRILEESGKKIAMASTINFKIAEKEWINKTKFTTLSSFSVQKFLRQAVDAGCEYVVLETSSHSLDQNRVWGVQYRTAVITNVTREHLDYHKNMEHYRIAKLKLFKRVQIAVVNLDMTNAKDYLDCASGIAKYGFTTRADVDVRKYDCGHIETVRAADIDLGINYAHFSVDKTRFELRLPGLFNVENALAAVSVGLAEGIAMDTMKTALEKITGVPGRMEHVPNDKNIDIIVDYALTPDSLEKLYNLVSLIR
ncbi:MAG: UDP-N-acetylmuramyl-tripeptide synthetase, partial [Candidatus Pacebacteria bacterium]|nr:UDP-N-acetylmuramyl-tripeptide synthetase [Candidatus Paceibacterota bacterium]